MEAHDFVRHVAEAKLGWRIDGQMFSEAARQVLENVGRAGPPHHSASALLLQRCFSPKALGELFSLNDAIRAIEAPSQIKDLLWLAMVSILRETSPVGTANWQYLLPNKTKARVTVPLEAFRLKTEQMYSDIRSRQAVAWGPKAHIISGDARSCSTLPNGWADFVITSPPYMNNFDYADATRLELTFLGEVETWSDLHEYVRKKLICSCSQHVSKRDALNDPNVLLEPLLAPILEEIAEVYHALHALSEERAGKKAYHSMTLRYFHGMAEAFVSLRRVTAPNCKMCFVIGDSAPYGVHVPVEAWLGRLAVAAGFVDWRFEKLRERNTKWKNRKHRVPLHEGILWMEG
ncbi:MAG: DNA modification methylase [Vulcanimicrobiaceae bacterium]